MATYVETDAAGPGGRAYVVDVPKVFRRNADGDLIEITSDAGRVNTNIVTATEFLPDYYAAKENAALVVENVTASFPENPSEAVIPSVLVNTLVGAPGETSGGNRDPGHVIGLFSETMIEAPCGTAFGSEFRVDPRREHLGVYVAIKHVIGPDDQNGGTIGDYIIEQFDDMRGPVKNIGSLQQNYLDPRLVTTHLGGNVVNTQQLTQNITLTKQQSGWFFMSQGTTDITVTLGPDVTPGCHFYFIQGSTAKIKFAVSPDKAWYAKGNQTETDGQFGECTVRVYPFGGTVGTFKSAV
ncbi:phage particle protein [Pseudomonas phage PaP4]|uniref:Phage particle protein n=1 Tax=Pseudomonas phage PaP4 TaxID=1273709 RepID=L7TMB7_9CAUD|nr:virion structural protein [Pseudomonas phage PaP4]AGC35283.1 phage particle protein [Pseudomonas phage PaP4]